MAISYISTVSGTAIVLCLSTDTKPTASANWVLFETDTAKTFKPNGSDWAENSAGSGDMLKSENLSGLVNYTTARTNLGLGSLATQSGTFSGTTSGTNTGDQNLSSYAPLASPSFTGTVSGVTKSMVGLANVDNTADSAKPVSTAQQTALDSKLNTTAFSGLTKISVGTVAPTSPSTGDLWIDTN